MLAFLASILLSFLPLRYRRWWRHEESAEMSKAAAVSGLLQVFLGLLFLAAGFVEYAPRAMIGPMAWMEYAFQPTSLLLLYLFLEGAVRVTVALTSGEALGTLPLYLVAWVHSGIQLQRAEAALGPKVVDLVERGDGTEFELRIASCRPKPNWDHLMTVSYQDELYEVAEQREGRPPRRFVYLLRMMPEGKIIRGLHHYRPDEVLDKD